ncbi:MAG TPA: RdgB/HAM1 family non-canonical purine NTP pyrophosphatase [Erysipelotrichaceae bacterium]|nr:RdgB/HAM1 family non-canonical purine NTP pyrophosphatase [Erysipelotrichaceae bacterium]
MSKNIVLVSNNAGKIKEVKSIVEPLGYKVLSLKDLKINADIIEDGYSFEENALIKARYLKADYDIIIADDSGLEIYGLDMQPGIYSARFLGSDLDYKLKNQKVIEMLKDKADKRARFVSVIALIYKGKEVTFRGEVMGEITDQIYGEGGFGYDPIFRPKGYSQTFGQLDDKLKNKISHRAVALKKLERYLLDEEKY